MKNHPVSMVSKDRHDACMLRRLLEKLKAHF